jgi:DNA-binding protein H-NS
VSNLSDLLAQRAALEQKIAQTQRDERQKAIAQIKTIMAEYGLTVTDLAARAGKSPVRAGSGNKVAAKYRNKATGETWSGRGLQPRWLKAALAAGKTLKEFAV